MTAFLLKNGKRDGSTLDLASSEVPVSVKELTEHMEQKINNFLATTETNKNKTKENKFMRRPSFNHLPRYQTSYQRVLSFHGTTFWPKFYRGRVAQVQRQFENDKLNNGGANKMVPFKSTPLPHVAGGELSKRHKSPEPKILEALGFFESMAVVTIPSQSKEKKKY